MRSNILKGISNPNYFLIAIAFVCVAALVFDVVVEYFFHMKACPVYQRYVYAIIYFVVSDGLFWTKKKEHKILLSAVLFFLNFGIAIYQVALQTNPSLFRAILSNEWWDFLYFPMAGYHALFAFLCGSLCLIFHIFYQDRNNERKTS